MTAQSLVYFDTSAILRVFDASRAPRVNREREDVLRLLEAVRSGRCIALWSRAHQLELAFRGPYQQAFVSELRSTWRPVRRSKAALAMARVYAATGLRGLDAVHLAYAASARARVLVTTDDAFRVAGARIAGLRVALLSPAAALLRLGLG